VAALAQAQSLPRRVAAAALATAAGRWVWALDRVVPPVLTMYGTLNGAHEDKHTCATKQVGHSSTSRPNAGCAERTAGEWSLPP
jgi:hypothetical protein